MRLFFMLATLALSQNIFATTIDFGEFPSGITPGSLVSKGFSFESDNDFVLSDLSLTSNALNFCPDCSLAFFSFDGSAFSLSSFDFTAVGSPDIGMLVTGTYQGGGTVALNMPVNSVTQTFNFGSDWSNLDQVVISTSGTPFANAIDNIVLTAVPIPAAVWLFGSALAGLGWMRRKRTI
jgi:hypothetical protein